MSFTVISGIIRHVLTALGGGLVVTGNVDADQANEVVGAIMTLTGVIWSIFDKKAR